MFRRLRTRRAIKAAEKISGLKKENSIFRGPSTSHHVGGVRNTITATFSEESETDATSSTMNHFRGETIQQINNEPYDVDVTINTTNTQDLDRSTTGSTMELYNNNNITTLDDHAAVLEQFQGIVQEIEHGHHERILEKDAIIQELSTELDRTRQDFIDVIVDLNVKEQELSATKQKLLLTEHELQHVTKDLFHMKQQLHTHGSTLIQCQHRLHEAEEELATRRRLSQRLGGFLNV